MTEQEWLNCTDPKPMLEFIWPRDIKGRRRLFCAACCRRVWHLLEEQTSRDAVELVEHESFVFGSDSHLQASRRASELPEVEDNLRALLYDHHGDWECALRPGPVAVTAAALATGLHAADTSDAAASAEAIEAALAAVSGNRAAWDDRIGRVAHAAWETTWKEPSAGTWNDRHHEIALFSWR